MTESVNYQKLADVLNRASAQGKNGFCKMLWKNQSESTRSQLQPLLSEQAQDVVSQE